jgi:hypothetical protein
MGARIDAEDSTMASRFMSVYEDLKARLKDGANRHFVLHTPIGAMRIDRIHDRKEIGYFYFDCRDDTGNQRFVCFSDEQMATFALEIRINKGAKGKLGFKADREK